jgi:hypothetical protein
MFLDLQTALATWMQIDALVIPERNTDIGQVPSNYNETTSRQSRGEREASASDFDYGTTGLDHRSDMHLSRSTIRQSVAVDGGG